VLMLVKLNIF